MSETQPKRNKMTDKKRMALSRLKGIKPKNHGIEFLPFDHKECHPKFSGCHSYIDELHFNYPSIFTIITNQKQDMPKVSRGDYRDDIKQFEVVFNKIGVHLIMFYGYEYMFDQVMGVFDLFTLKDLIKEEINYIENQKQRSLEEWF